MKIMRQMEKTDCTKTAENTEMQTFEINMSFDTITYFECPTFAPAVNPKLT